MNTLFDSKIKVLRDIAGAHEGETGRLASNGRDTYSVDPLTGSLRFDGCKFLVRYDRIPEMLWGIYREDFEIIETPDQTKEG